MMEATQTTSAPAFASDPADALQEYRSLSVLALLSLLLGLLSPLALTRPLLIFVPLAAIAAAVLALSRIRSHEGRLAGRWPALVGMCLGVIFATAVPAVAVTRDNLLHRQSQPIAQQFFTLLAQDEPHKAIQLMRQYRDRQPFGDRLWDHYRQDIQSQERLREFVENETVRALLAMGQRAQVRFYRGVSTSTTSPRIHIEQLYAVTYDDESGKKASFLLRVVTERLRSRDGLISWRIIDFSPFDQLDALYLDR